MNAQMQIQALSAAVLATLDFIVLVDHSGSMGSDSAAMEGKTRLEEVEEQCLQIARVASKHDDDGITVIAFNNRVNAYDGVKADAVHKIFQEFPPGGSTNLGGALTAAFDKVRASSKNAVVLVYTDGAPDSKPDVIKAITGAANEFGRPKMGITFIQVGDDKQAAEFLEKLNSDLKGCPDCVAVVNADDAQNLGLDQLAWLAQNG
jgi:Mg-chelatase subunit ChlD